MLNDPVLLAFYEDNTKASFERVFIVYLRKGLFTGYALAYMLVAALGVLHYGLYTNDSLIASLYTQLSDTCVM